MSGISFDTIECMKKEVEILSKIKNKVRDGFDTQLRTKLFITLRNYELISLLERRYMYGCDIEVDLQRLLGKQVEFNNTTKLNEEIK